MELLQGFLLALWVAFTGWAYYLAYKRVKALYDSGKLKETVIALLTKLKDKLFPWLKTEK